MDYSFLRVFQELAQHTIWTWWLAVLKFFIAARTSSSLMSWFSSASYSEACVSSSLSSSLVFSERLSSHEFVPKTDLKCANHSSEEISLPLPAPLSAFQNDCWSRRFFRQAFTLVFFVFPFFTFGANYGVFSALLHKYHPWFFSIVSTIVSHFVWTAYIHYRTMEPLAFFPFDWKMFSSLARQRSAKETQICQAPCSDHVQSVQSPLPEYL